MSHADWNTTGIFCLLTIILFFVSGTSKGLARLRRSEHYINTLARIKSLDYAPNSIVTIDSNGIVISWNLGAIAMFGYREKEVVGKPLVNILPEKYKEGHLRGMERMKDGMTSSIIGKSVEMEGINKKGVAFPIELTIWKWNDGPNTFFTGIIKDITVEKAKDIEMADILSMHERGEEIDKSGMWSWDVLNDVVRTSDGFNKIFGIEHNKVDSTYLLKRVYHEDLSRVEAAIKQAFENKEGYSIRYRIVNTNGVLKEVEINAETYFNDNNELVNITGTIHVV